MVKKGDRTVGIAVGFRWERVGRVQRDSDGGLLFPSTGFVPGVYRFRLVGAGSERHYVGEASDLRQRFQRYRTPDSGQKTNLRINGLIREHLEVGGDVEVDLAAEGVKVSSRGRPIPVDLADKAMRRLLESAAVVGTAAADGLELLSL